MKFEIKIRIGFEFEIEIRIESGIEIEFEIEIRNSKLKLELIFFELFENGGLHPTFLKKYDSQMGAYILRRGRGGLYFLRAEVEAEGQLVGDREEGEDEGEKNPHCH